LSTTFDTYFKQNDTVDHSGATGLELGLVGGNITRSEKLVRGRQKISGGY